MTLSLVMIAMWLGFQDFTLSHIIIIHMGNIYGGNVLSPASTISKALMFLFWEAGSGLGMRLQKCIVYVYQVSFL